MSLVGFANKKCGPVHAGNDRYFKPVGVYTPVAGGPDPSVVPKITARKCTCVNGWTSSKGSKKGRGCFFMAINIIDR